MSTIATLEAELGVCSFCKTENWVHKMPTPVAEVTAETVEELVKKGEITAQDIADATEEPRDLELPKEEVAESIPEEAAQEVDAKAAKIAKLEAKIKKLKENAE